MPISRLPLVCLAALGLMPALLDTVRAESKQVVLTVVAAITPGCRLGSGPTDVSGFGDIDLGSFANMDKPVQRVSSVGAGSIVINCTPGTDYRISINDGQNPSGTAGYRRMKNLTSQDTTFLTYILYQNAAYSQVWGEGAQSKSGSARGGVEEFPVYIAVLAKADARPGVYSDTVIVTVSY